MKIGGELRSCCRTVTHKWCFCGTPNTVPVFLFLTVSLLITEIFNHHIFRHINEKLKHQIGSFVAVVHQIRKNLQPVRFLLAGFSFISVFYSFMKENVSPVYDMFNNLIPSLLGSYSVILY